MTSVLAPVANTANGINGMKNLAIGTEAFLMGFDLSLVGKDFIEKKKVCDVYKDSFFLNGESSHDYFECLEALSDIKMNGLIAVATGGLSAKLITRQAGQSTIALDEAAEAARKRRSH